MWNEFKEFWNDVKEAWKKAPERLRWFMIAVAAGFVLGILWWVF